MCRKKDFYDRFTTLFLKLVFAQIYFEKNILEFLQEPKDKMPLATRNELRPVRPAHYADSFWATYIISVAAASVAETATYPLDLTKTRLQIQGEAANVAGAKTVGFSMHRLKNKTKNNEMSQEQISYLKSVSCKRQN